MKISSTHVRPSVLVPQVLLGWKYGDCVDEKAKIHPQLRTYKGLTEKVGESECEIWGEDKQWRDNWKIEASGLGPCTLFLSLCFRKKRFTDGQLESPWRACWQWAGASTGPKMEKACHNRGRVRKCEKSPRLHRCSAENMAETNTSVKCACFLENHQTIKVVVKDNVMRRINRFVHKIISLWVQVWW